MSWSIPLIPGQGQPLAPAPRYGRLTREEIAPQGPAGQGHLPLAAAQSIQVASADAEVLTLNQ